MSLTYTPKWKICSLRCPVLTAWKSVIAVAAIDCADDANHVICIAEQVSGYPSMKVQYALL